MLLILLQNKQSQSGDFAGMMTFPEALFAWKGFKNIGAQFLSIAAAA